MSLVLLRYVASAHSMVDEMTILVVDGYAKLYLREGVLRARDKEGNTMEQTLPDLELVVIIGRGVLVTTAALQALATNNIPVVFFDSRTSSSVTLFNPIQVGLIDTRDKQYMCLRDETCKLRIASKIIKAKLKGLYNLITYELKYHREQVHQDTSKLIQATGLHPAWVPQGASTSRHGICKDKDTSKHRRRQ